MLNIRQGATHKVVIGPVVAVGDGFTPVTTLALNTADEAEVILHDNGTVVDISGYTFAAITTADGYYHLTLQSGISNTVGHMTVVINDDSLCLPVRADFTILEEAVYDALYASSAPGYVANAPVNMVQISGDSTAADNLETAYDDTAGPVPWHDVIDQGTAQSGSTSTTLVLRAALSLGDDIINGAAVRIVSGTGAGQTRLVDDFVGSTDTVTVSPAWTTTPDNTSVYRLLACPPASTNSLPQVDVYKIEGVDATDQLDVHAAAGLDAAGVRAAVGLTSANLDTQLSTIDSTADAILADTADMQPKLGTPAADISADIAAVKVDSAAILDDTGTTGVKVDDSTPIDANIEQINTVPIVGDGSGTPFEV